MKKIYLSLACAAASAMAVSAQQLPNVGFEGEWELNRPWNTVCDTLSFKAAAATMGADAFGMQPKGWVISNVNGVVSPRDEEWGGGYGALGATMVGDTCAGFNSATAVRLFNAPNPFMATQIVPAYLTLGTSWATNTLDWTTFQPANKDGGTFGGMELSAAPDALTFMYKWQPINANDTVTVLVYSWKGHWTQDSVPGNNSMSSDVVTCTMTDRDRNILGMETAQGGTVTKTDDAELIANTLHYFTGAQAEWTAKTVEIDYVSDAKPEMINVVLAANNYFNSNDIVKGDTLMIDDVKFIYRSQLKSLAIAGVDVEGFNPDTYTYTLEGEAPTAADQVAAVANGRDAQVKVELAAGKVVVTVSNVGEDADGKTEHVYTINYGSAAGDVVTTSYDGTLTIEMFGSDLTGGGQAATINIERAEGASTCTFKLPNFSLDLGDGPTELGDIVVNDVEITTGADGTETYKGHVDGLELLGGDIVADVDLQGTIDAAGNADMDINVTWNGIPIYVHFTGHKSGIAAVAASQVNAPVEMFDIRGNRVNADNLPAGIYIRRQGNQVTKILVK